MRRRSWVLSLLLLLSVASILGVLQSEDNLRAQNETTSTPFFTQSLTTLTTTIRTETFARVCGNTPWNDSIVAHCGLQEIPEFAWTLDFLLMTLMLAVAITTIRDLRTVGRRFKASFAERDRA